MNQWINKTSESTTHWNNHWINESVNQYIMCFINEATNHRINEPMNQRFDESNNQWMNERMNGSNDGRNEWAAFFVELLLHWATSSLRHLFSQLLSYFFSEQPLIWATSALNCRPWLLRSSINLGPLFAQLFQSRPAIRNPACQERRSITNAFPRAALPMHFVTAALKPPNQPTLAQCQHYIHFSALRCAPQFFRIF